MLMVKRVLRTPEAAAYCGLSPSTLEKRRLTGGGPVFVHLGKRCIGYRLEDLDSWIDGHANEREATVAQPARVVRSRKRVDNE